MSPSSCFVFPFLNPFPICAHKRGTFQITERIHEKGYSKRDIQEAAKIVQRHQNSQREDERLYESVKERRRMREIEREKERKKSSENRKQTTCRGASDSLAGGDMMDLLLNPRILQIKHFIFF